MPIFLSVDVLEPPNYHSFRCVRLAPPITGEQLAPTGRGFHDS